MGVGGGGGCRVRARDQEQLPGRARRTSEAAASASCAAAAGAAAAAEVNCNLTSSCLLSPSEGEGAGGSCSPLGGRRARSLEAHRSGRGAPRGSPQLPGTRIQPRLLSAGHAAPGGSADPASLTLPSLCYAGWPAGLRGPGPPPQRPPRLLPLAVEPQRPPATLSALEPEPSRARAAAAAALRRSQAPSQRAGRGVGGGGPEGRGRARGARWDWRRRPDPQTLGMRGSTHPEVPGWNVFLKLICQAKPLGAIKANTLSEGELTTYTYLKVDILSTEELLQDEKTETLRVRVAC
ncbi:synapsin-1-like [Lontra canadensis]|uniref:synapsin-1-like n=1 Tax=Lontra canadensis TaxID=76717 RepID=UPI0013F39F52|nr:synapsin-1-like [Lontra canadensis]